MFSLAALGQTPADLCRIEGTVLNALTGLPVRKAQVILMPKREGEPVYASSDVQGKYVLTNVKPGEYFLNASHDGYLIQRYGAKKPGDDQKADTLSLTPGSVKNKVDVQLTPMGAIMGHIRDENGDPVRQVEVAAMAYGYGPTGRALQERGGGQTDAAGEFKIYDLAPGKYYLRARPQSAQSPGSVPASDSYATMYYPNATQQSAAGAIEVGVGQEQRGIDISLRPVTTSFIRGRVIAPLGGEHCSAALEDGDDALPLDVGFGFSGMRQVIMGAVSGAMSMTTNPDDIMLQGGVNLDKQGKFDLRNIPLGSHSLTGSCTVAKQRYTIKTTVQLEAAGIENLELRPLAPSTLTGRVTVEGESKNKVTAAHVWLPGAGIPMIFGASSGVGGERTEPADGVVGEDGKFSFHNLPADIHHLTVEPMADTYVKSVMSGGRDVRESGVDLSAGGMTAAVEVVLSANGGTVEGTVENGEGAMVTLIPADASRVRTLAKSELADADGHFSFQAVPPGRYKLFASEGVDVNAVMYDAEFRKPYEGEGQTVDVEEKQKFTLQLKTIPKVEQ